MQTDQNINRKCTHRVILLSGTVATLIGVSPLRIASAQTPAATGQAAGSGKLEEVIVTAQRRRQDVQKAPVAISVLSSKAITNAGVTTAVDLTRLLASAQIEAAAGPFPILYIRGVGSNTGNSFTDSAVSLSYGGVPLARTYNGLGQYYDLDRVEVLIGPQGTLYGRNATGGVINIIPTPPALDRQSGYFGVDYGNYNTLFLTGAANQPIGDTAAIRIAFRTNRNDAYYSEDDGAANDQAVRVQLRWDPTADLSTNTDADYVHIGGNATNGVSESGITYTHALAAPGDVVGNTVLAPGFAPSQGVSATDPRMISIYAANGLTAPKPGTDGADNSLYGLQSTINYRTDFGTFTVIPAFRYATLNFLSYGGGFGNGDIERDDQESVEARFASPENQRLKWIAGAFFLHDHAASNTTIDAFEPSFIGVSLNQNFSIDTKSYAPFADATFNVTPKLRLIAGARYTIDEKTPTGRIDFSNDTSFTLNNVPTHTWEDFTYRGGVEWDIAPQSMLYATYSTGWHSGGFFLTPDNPLYQPEKIGAATIGSKNRFLDGKLQANIEAFRWKYDNQQTSFVTFDSVGSAVFATKNVGSSTREGADVELQYKLTDTSILGSQVEYLDAEYQKFEYQLPSFLGPNTGCLVTDGGGGMLDVNCAHTRVPFAPRWTGNVNFTQNFPLRDDANIAFLARAHLQTATDTGSQDVPVEMQRSYATIDASLGYTAPNNRWSVTLFGNNITDQVIKSQTNQSPASGILGAHQPIYFVTLQTPALYGVRLRVSF